MANEETLRQESKPMFDATGGADELVDFGFALGNAAFSSDRKLVFLSRSACPLRWFGTGRPCF